LQGHISVDALVEDSTLRDSHTPLERSARMASHSDMSNLLSILAKCDEYESCISCCTSSVVYCDVTGKNLVAMSRHHHNVTLRHYDGLRRCCYNGVN
jgi:hypothetical protein